MKRELAKVKEARRRLEKVRARLMRGSLESLDACGADLNSAVECLQDLECEMRSPHRGGVGFPALAAEIRTLRTEAQQAETLFQAAGQFYAGWARLLASDADCEAANYSARGKTKSPVSIDRRAVVVHG